MPKLLFLLSLFLVACGSTETLVRDRTINIPAPVIHDTVWASKDTVVELSDSMPTLLIEGEKIVGKDTVVKIKYVRAKGQSVGRFEITVKPDSVKYHDIDTTKAYRPIIQEFSFLSRVGLGAVCLVIGIVMGFLIGKGKLL